MGRGSGVAELPTTRTVLLLLCLFLHSPWYPRVLTFPTERPLSTWYPRVSSQRERWFWRSGLMKSQVVYRRVYRPLMASTVLTPTISQGAGALSEYLLATFGRNAFALIVDEGGLPVLFAWT